MSNTDSVKEEMMQARCNALELYCASLEKDLKALRVEHDTSVAKNMVLQERILELERQVAAKTATASIVSTAAPASTSSSVPRSTPVQRSGPTCSECGRPVSGNQTMSVWDGSRGQHVSRPSRLCDRCQRSMVLAL